EERPRWPGLRVEERRGVGFLFVGGRFLVGGRFPGDRQIGARHVGRLHKRRGPVGLGLRWPRGGVRGPAVGGLGIGHGGRGRQGRVGQARRTRGKPLFARLDERELLLVAPRELTAGLQVVPLAAGDDVDRRLGGHVGGGGGGRRNRRLFSRADP